MSPEFNIPELTKQSVNSTSFIFSRIFKGGGPRERKTYGLVVNFIRLTDLAVSEYSAGRSEALRLTFDGQTCSNFQTSAHFEVCIDALRRAIRFLKAIKSHQDAPQELKKSIPKYQVLLSSEAEGKIRKMRDAIQHLEEEILRGNMIREGQSLVLKAGSNALELGELKITYAELADWLNDANTLSQKIANYREIDLH